MTCEDKTLPLKVCDMTDCRLHLDPSIIQVSHYIALAGMLNG